MPESGKQMKSLSPRSLGERVESPHRSSEAVVVRKSDATRFHGDMIRRDRVREGRGTRE